MYLDNLFYEVALNQSVGANVTKKRVIFEFLLLTI